MIKDLKNPGQLYRALIRLAHSKPDLREELLPILEKHGAPKKDDYPNAIELTCSDDALPGVLGLLKELRKLGRVGSSRSIKIEDWDGKSSFDFDGDGWAKIGEIKVNGEVEK